MQVCYQLAGLLEDEVVVILGSLGVLGSLEDLQAFFGIAVAARGADQDPHHQGSCSRCCRLKCS